jgi:hypothetical protein
MGLRGKIGVYGRSLGGIPTTHIADKVNMIIADRTFSNFKSLSTKKFYSSSAEYLWKVGSCGWKIASDWNIVNKGTETCYKLIVIDKFDELVDAESSLMIGVAKIVAEQ